MTLFIIAALAAALPALMYFRNVQLFRPPPEMATGTPSVSVLIPARNEALSIEGCVRSVLENVGVDLEVIVLDDHSTDGTAEIVRSIPDPRVRVEMAPPLPPGWSGKQHACFALAKLATKPILTFLDADVRLSPTALSRMIAFQQSSGAALVSGFPQQQTGTLLEKLLIPLMHYVLLGFLPIARMRTHPDASLGAGCGQWFLTTRESYDTVGGHETVKASFHDGVKLPRAYRRAGFMTDLCDVTNLATCRMYRNGLQVWNGLAKNAREGMGTNAGIIIWTVLLFSGSVLPWFVLATAPLPLLHPAAVVVIISLLPRLHAAWRFQQSWLGALLHPLGILLLLAIQWYALLRAMIGKPVGWKGRVLGS